MFNFRNCTEKKAAATTNRKKNFSWILWTFMYIFFCYPTECLMHKQRTIWNCIFTKLVNGKFIMAFNEFARRKANVFVRIHGKSSAKKKTIHKRNVYVTLLSRSQHRIFKYTENRPWEQSFLFCFRHIDKWKWPRAFTIMKTCKKI